MSIIKCTDCQKEVSDQAETCPNCGFPVAKMIRAKQEEEIGCGVYFITGLVIMAVCLPIIYFCGKYLLNELGISF